MAENSLFAVLLRSPWWISMAVGIAVALGMAALLPASMRFYGAFAAAPFLVIGAVAGWRQFQAPSAARVDRALTTIRAMSSAEFTAVVEARLRSEGYEVTRLAGSGADFAALRASRRTLVGCRRFKTARTGIKPLEDLRGAMQSQEADDGLYIAAGDVTEQARQFAARNRIRVMQGPELATWLPSLTRR
jgi:restriction system protein